MPRNELWYLEPEELQGGISIGGKAAGLLHLRKARLRTPDWLVIPTERAAVRPWTRGGNLQRLTQRVRPWFVESGGVMVRSSAVGEDSASASYAGVFASVYVQAPEDLANALERVADSVANASSYSGHVVASPPTMAIIVQAAILPEISGVAFSASPASALPGEVYVEAVLGAGSKLVDGLGAASRFQISIESGTVSASDTGADGPQALSRVVAKGLLRAVLKLEELLGFAVDVEWCYLDRKLYFLQVRPMTALAVDVSLRPQVCSTSWFFDQRFSDPISPLSRSTLLPLISEVAIGDALKMRGENAADASIQYHGGQAYVAHETWRRMLAGAPRWWLTEDLRQLFPRDCFCERKRGLLAAPVAYATASVATVIQHRRDVFNNISEWNHFRDGLGVALEGLPAGLPESREEWTQRWGVLDDLSRRFLRIHRWSLLWADYAYRAYRLFLGTIGETRAAGVEAQLRSELGLVTVAANEMLLGHLQGDVPLETFVERLGHRSSSLDYAMPTWGELAEAGKLGAVYGERPAREVKQHAERGAVPLLLKPMWGLLLQLLRLREEQRFHWERILARQRGMARAAGEALAARRVLRRAEEVWDLRVEELLAALYDGAAIERGVIELRRHAIRLERLVRKPQFIGPELPRPREYSQRTWTGVAASAGVARGRAHVLRQPGAPPAEGRPYIALVRNLDPAWTPLLGAYAGFVVERGGLLSHGAVVAREYGVPMVMGVEGALEEIPDGAQLEIDGGRGTVDLR